MKQLHVLSRGRARGALRAPDAGQTSRATRRKPLWAVAVAFSFATLWLAVSVVAHTIREEHFACPIDGHSFSEYVSASGTQWGLRLDNKPLGPIAAPWDIAQCPKCKFVLAEQAYDAATVAKLKPFVLSDAYRNSASNGPTYYCLARLREFLAADPMKVADAYLKASWQTEREPAKSQEYLRAALASFLVGLKSLKPEERHWARIERLCGELERRLGQFDQAAARLQRLKAIEASNEDHSLIARQLQFIAEKDSAPHAAREELEHLVLGKKPAR